MSLDEVRSKLGSAFHEGILRRTYDSVRGRINPEGYVPESLTGVYAGMFPRTIGALAQLLIDTGEADVAEHVVHYCIQGMLDNDMDRIPHVIGERDESGKIPLLCDEDQVDGQAHVILAWALLAQSRGRTPYEDLSYAIVAKLLDRTVSGPYFLPDSTGGRDLPGLVRNLNLEHHRDGHFWDTYDFLTQAFVASALEKMIPIATGRKDARHAEFWGDRLARLTANVAANFTRDLDGTRIYYEMLLPGERAFVPYPGISWLNFAAIPAGWQGVDETVMDNTIAALRRLGRIEWVGPPVTSCDWLPEGHTDSEGRQRCNMVIGKVLGWDMLYALRKKQYDYLVECLDFLEKTNTHDVFAEAFCYEEDTGAWRLNDPGNGEQACWWVWCMVRIRREVGLPPLPSA